MFLDFEWSDFRSPLYKVFAQVNFIADYIKVDKSKRLKFAYQLLRTIRLAIVYQDLDFAKLGKFFDARSKRRIHANKAESLCVCLL